MEQSAQQTLMTPASGEINGEIRGAERTNGRHNGMSREHTEPLQAPSATDAGQQARVATATFGEIVALLSFSPVFKHLSLADLEWLVVPALATNQVTVVRGKLKDQNGLLVPIGLALWAHVSEDVDNKLEAQQQANIPFRLAPQDWKSGEIPWLLAVLAPKEVWQALVKKLEESVFKGKTYKRFAMAPMDAGMQASTKEREGQSTVGHSTLKNEQIV